MAYKACRPDAAAKLYRGGGAWCAVKFSEEVGTASVHRARRAITSAFGAVASEASSEGRPRPEWEERGGVFVTLRSYPKGLLRGCIGFPRPVLPRGEAIDQAARAAAFDDPRFPPLARSELSQLLVEVSLLSVPEPIVASDAEGRRAGVVVGRDGLIVSVGYASGLLLPQVAAEEGWDAERFLQGTCEKAGLPPDAWQLPSTRVERFEATVFAEVAPNGEVVVELGPTASLRPSAPKTGRGSSGR